MITKSINNFDSKSYLNESTSSIRRYHFNAVDDPDTVKAGHIHRLLTHVHTILQYVFDVVSKCTYKN